MNYTSKMKRVDITEKSSTVRDTSSRPYSHFPSSIEAPSEMAGCRQEDRIEMSTVVAGGMTDLYRCNLVLALCATMKA